MQERFFIIGCQRSGTTLMRLILESHPDVFCYDELKGYGVLCDPEREPTPTARRIGFKIPCWTEQLLLPVLRDEGLPESCDNFYRGEEILFLHREIRDTIASMLKLNAGDASWCEVWGRKVLNAKVAREETFRRRYTAELQVIADHGTPLAGIGALYWKYKTDAFFDYLEQGLPVHPVFYERLLEAPRLVLEKVCEHLGIPFHENLLRHHETAHSELFDDGLTVGGTDPKRAMYRDSIGQWERYLSASDTQVIDFVVGDLPERVAALDVSFDSQPSSAEEIVG